MSAKYGIRASYFGRGGGSPRSCLFKVTPKSQPVKQCYHPRTSVCYSSRFDLRWQGHKDYPLTANADSGVLRRGTPTIGFGGVLYREERMPHCPSRTETNELDIGYFLSIEARICQMNILRYPEKPCVLQANHSRLITMNNIQGIVVIV